MGVSAKRGPESGPQAAPIPIPGSPIHLDSTFTAPAPVLSGLAAVLAGVAPQDIQAIVAHVQALVSLSPARRQAIITLTQPVE